MLHAVYCVRKYFKVFGLVCSLSANPSIPAKKTLPVVLTNPSLSRNEVSPEAQEAFLFPVKALGDMFRGKYMAELSATDEIPKHIRAKCFSKPWVVYAKSPVSSAESTLEYLARYAY